MQSCHRTLSLLWTVLAVCLVSCDHDNPKNFPGEYVYRGKSGQIESLNFKEDGTFQHALYSDEKTFVTNGEPVFALNSKWTFQNGKRNARLLNLHPVLGPFTKQPEQLLQYPDLPWVPWFEGNQPALFFDESYFYWLVRVNRREDIAQLKFRYP
jgi:hypothetical protein